MKLDDQTDAPLPQLAPRSADSHKGDFGRALLVGGSRGMAGAIALAGRATLRSGAGLVTLAVPQCVQDVVASFEPSYMTRGLPDANGQLAKMANARIRDAASEATAIAIGPGLGRSDLLTDVIEDICVACAQPMVVDADALFGLAKRPSLLNGSGGPRILTPHPGEFERLIGKRPNMSDPIEAAAALAHCDSKRQTIVVLKGHRTVTTDGARFSVNHTGNPGMATGGTGDVLTGIITALLCQGLTPFDAARLGVYVHGLAGDLAAQHLGQVSLIASDLIHYLPKAFQTLSHA